MEENSKESVNVPSETMEDAEVMSEVHLGCPPNFTGPYTSHFAFSLPHDHGVEVLDNCARNVHINSGLLRSESSVKVRELDWLKPWPPLDLDSGIRYSWTSTDVEELDRASVLLAADVIYSDELTDAFFSILQKLMCQHSEKVLYLALEKRYNFSLYDLDVVANGYSHFLSFLRDEKGFTGKCIDLSDIPQYVRDYERGNDVELWEIKYVAPKC